jgi:hypothetical protein
LQREPCSAPVFRRAVFLLLPKFYYFAPTASPRAGASAAVFQRGGTLHVARLNIYHGFETIGRAFIACPPGARRRSPHSVAQEAHLRIEITGNRRITAFVKE